MCLFSPSSNNESAQTTSSSTCEKVNNLNTSGNSGTALTTGGNASIVSTTNTTNNSTCGAVVKTAISCADALAGGSIRTIACLAKSLSLNLDDESSSENSATLALASCLVKSDQKFASQSICAVARLACQSDNAIACLEAKQTASNNTLLSAVAGTLSGIATANDTTESSQSTAFATTALKYGAVVVLGLAAVAVIYAVSKK